MTLEEEINRSHNRSHAFNMKMFMRKKYPDASPTHLVEAIARGFGFKTYAALRNDSSQRVDAFDEKAFEKRLEELKEKE